MSTSSIKVVLLIDEQSLAQPLFPMTELLTCIRQILIFYGSLTKNVEWSYRFFSTNTRYSNISMRHFENLTEESLETLQREYDNLSLSKTKSGTPFAHIIQAMKDAIGDFRWDHESFNPSQNYMFILTPCPLTIPELEDFFDTATDEVMDKRLDDLTQELAISHVDAYTQRHISASIIDTTNSLDLSKTEFAYQNYVRKIFLSLLEPFNGNYIKAQKLMNYDNKFGNSIISHSANFLPLKPVYQPTIPAPAWKGIFTTADNNNQGSFILYPNIRNAPYDFETLAFIGQIRIAEFIHISQVSPLWLPCEETASSYTLCPASGNTKNEYFGDLMGMLNAERSVLIVELVPLKDFEIEDDRQMAIIEPLTPLSGSLRLLNKGFTTASLWKPVDVPKPDPYYPLGGANVFSDLRKANLKEKWPKEGPTEAPKFVSFLPDFLEKKLAERVDEDKQKIEIMDTDEEEVEERIIILPPDVSAFGMQFKKLYDEALYFRKDTLEVFITIVDKWVDHLLSLNIPSIDIINTFEKYALNTVELDIKHKEQVAKADLVPSGTGTTEQQYQSEWWKHLREYKKYDKEFVELSLTSLRIREAQLQVILHTFICKLLKKNPTVNITLDADETAQAFFVKMVLLFSCNKVEDFLLELDADDDSPTARDPCDLLDLNFANVLEQQFKDCLPELVTHFKEAAGYDDLMSIPDDDEEDMLALEVAAQRKEKKIPEKKIIPKNKQAARPPSAFIPEKPKRTYSNPMDELMKRTINMSTKVDTSTQGRMGEAARAAQAKIERTMVNGKPTMKRAGSFIKSAISPKRPQITFNDGPVTVRKQTVVDPKVTPRTSLNRFLNADIFTDYSEYCVSPTRDNPSTAQLLPSAYPRTPQGTSSRFRKTMMETTPHRHDDNEVGFSLTDRFETLEEEGRQSPGFSFADRILGIAEEDKNRIEPPSMDQLTISQRKSKIDDLFKDDDSDEN